MMVGFLGINLYDKMAAFERIGTEPTELNGAASLELGEISSDASVEGSFSSTSTVSTLSLLDALRSLKGCPEITEAIYSS